MKDADFRSPAGAERTEEFVQLLSLYQRRVYLFILAMLPNVADAEEVLQETSLVLWKKFEQFELGTDFRVWAFQIARFEVLKFRSRARREPARQRFSEGLLNEIAATAASQLNVLDRRQVALEKCIEELSLRDRDLVARRGRAGATVAIVAMEVGRPLDGMYKVFQRIHRLLSTCIERRIAAEDA